MDDIDDDGKESVLEARARVKVGSLVSCMGRIDLCMELGSHYDVRVGVSLHFRIDVMHGLHQW